MAAAGAEQAGFGLAHHQLQSVPTPSRSALVAQVERSGYAVPKAALHLGMA
jgi:hypothetical protein